MRFRRHTYEESVRKPIIPVILWLPTPVGDVGALPNSVLRSVHPSRCNNCLIREMML
jgi:hypothetical protein